MFGSAYQFFRSYALRYLRSMYRPIIAKLRPIKFLFFMTSRRNYFYETLDPDVKVSARFWIRLEIERPTLAWRMGE